MAASAKGACMNMIALLWHNIVNRCLDCWRWYHSEVIHVNLRKINDEYRIGKEQ